MNSASEAGFADAAKVSLNSNICFSISNGRSPINNVIVFKVQFGCVGSASGRSCGSSARAHFEYLLTRY